MFTVRKELENMDDPYVLENGTLINKLGITEYDELKKSRM